MPETFSTRIVLSGLFWHKVAFQLQVVWYSLYVTAAYHLSALRMSLKSLQHETSTACHMSESDPGLKSFASRHRRRSVGSIGKVQEKSSIIEANKAAKSITLKGVLKNSVRRKQNLSCLNARFLWVPPAGSNSEQLVAQA